MKKDDVELIFVGQQVTERTIPQHLPLWQQIHSLLSKDTWQQQHLRNMQIEENAKRMKNIASCHVLLSECITLMERNNKNLTVIKLDCKYRGVLDQVFNSITGYSYDVVPQLSGEFSKSLTIQMKKEVL